MSERTPTKFARQRFFRPLATLLPLLLLMVGALLLGSTTVHAQADVTTIQGTDPISIKKIVDRDHAEVGQTLVYTITVENNSTGAIDGLRMEDALPAGLLYVADSGQADSGAFDFNADFNQVGWRGALQPQSQVTIVFKARIHPEHQDNRCGRELINHAVVIVDNVREIFTPETIVKLVCPDLGDAPDSTNHQTGTTMEAYPEYRPTSHGLRSRNRRAGWAAPPGPRG
ncbi:MAG: hypothetical protein R2867_01715 [Caldilineaceae bacterium]